MENHADLDKLEEEAKSVLDAIALVRQKRDDLAKAEATLNRIVGVAANDKPKPPEEVIAREADADAEQDVVPSGRVPVLRLFRNIVGELDGVFTRRMVEERFQERFPDLAISPSSSKGAMVNLAKSGEIVVLVHPHGRRNGQYRRA